MALLNIPGYTSQPFDYQGLLADARHEARRQGLLGAGIGLLTQGPSPYPIGFLSSVGRGLAGYQAGQQTGFDTALQRGVDAARLGMLNNEQALNLYNLQRKYDQGEELIAGLSGQPSAGLLAGGGATPGLLNQPAAAPADGALYETSRSTPASSPAQISQPIAAPADPYTQLAQAVSMPESGGRQFDDKGQVILGPMTAGGWQAVGKMQLSPDTAKRLGVDPYNEAQNFAGGLAYLKELVQQTGGNVDEALRIYGGFQPGDPNAAGYIQKVKANLPQGWSLDGSGGAAAGTQVAQAAPAGVQTASDQTLKAWFQSQPQAYQQMILSQLRAGTDPDEVFKTLHEDFMKGHYGAPMVDPIMGPGQYNLQSGEFKTKGGTNVSIYPDVKGDITYEEERSKSLTKDLEDVAKGADKAYQNAQFIEGISTAAQALGAQGGQTGPLEPFKADIGAVLTNLGINILPDDPGYAKTIQGLTQQLALGKIGEGGMPANNFSEADRNFIVSTVAGLGDTPTAFMLKLEIQKRMNARAIAAQQMWDDGLASKRYTDSKEGARQFLADLRTEVRGKPLFTDEERKAIIDTARAAGPQGGVDYQKKYGLTPKEQ